MKEVKVQGNLAVDVVYVSQRETLPLLVVSGNGPSLLGRDWLLKLHLDWQSLYCLKAVLPTVPNLQAVIDSHSAVFKDELGRMTGVMAK